MPTGPFARVLASELPIGQKCPVGRLEREQLPDGAGVRRCGRGEQLQLCGPGLPGEIGNGGSAPGSQVTTAPPAADRQLGGCADWVVAPERVVEGRQTKMLAGRLLQHRPQPVNAFVPPVAEQLGVERAHAHTAVADATRNATHEIARVLGRQRSCLIEVVRLAVVSPSAVVMGRVAVVVAIRARRGIAAICPHERHDLAVQRPQDWASVHRQRCQVPRIAESEQCRQLDAGGAHALLRQQRIEPRCACALG